MPQPKGTRAEVRTAVEAFFANQIALGNIPTLGTVYGYPEKIMDEAEMYANVQPGTSDGAFLFLHLMRSRDDLAAFQEKRIVYELTMTFVFRSTKDSAVDAGIDNETMLDAVVKTIRANRTCGTTDGTIFQWGLGSKGSTTDIEVESFYPQSLHASQAATQIQSIIKLQVVQIIQA
jgi:hypothetical protein